MPPNTGDRSCHGGKHKYSQIVLNRLFRVTGTVLSTQNFCDVVPRLHVGIVSYVLRNIVDVHCRTGRGGRSGPTLIFVDIRSSKEEGLNGDVDTSTQQEGV